MQLGQNNNLWSIGPVEPGVPSDFIHIWRVPLNPEGGTFDRLKRYLSPDELSRAARFRFDLHRIQFIVAHGILREILSRYLHISPVDFVFNTSEYGKPSLTEHCGGDLVTFNLSHSHELGLVGIASRRSIGVDIEYIRDDLADEQVARRFFSAREVDKYLSLPSEERKQAFFACWTRKEAYIKAIGEGLSMPLDRFDVSLAPGEPAEILETRPDPAQALQWMLYALNPAPEYQAAVVVQGRFGRVCCWQWSERV